MRRQRGGDIASPSPVKPCCLFLLVVVHDLVIGVVELTLLGGSGVRTGLRALGIGLLVQLFADGVESLGQRLRIGLDSGGVIALEGFLQLVEGALNLALIVSGDFVAHIG